ncbi:MAG TPA: DUF4160 domain-containing protein [Rhizomicrobium sp.]|jgi:hypothetical protein|nr:DUF4160 domain-containing protein [Rhizomicrobium sp.]
MPAIFSGPNWKITMYFRDHPPPHFHVVTSSREEAQVSIDSLSVMAGRVRPAILAAARDRAKMHAALLYEKWIGLHPT